MPRDREPHIGEYDAKTNAICDFSQFPTVSELGQEPARSGDSGMRVLLLLPVVFQHLIAGRGQLGTILLQASQNGEVALIYHGTAEALNIARTSRLLLRRAAALLLLGAGSGGHR
jgi:hypothetical protein